MDRFYLVKLNTNSPEHKLPELDLTFVKEVKLQFGSSATVYWVPQDAAFITAALELKPDE